MARNVTDAAVLLGAMTGVDPADPATTGQVVTRSPTTPGSSTTTRSRTPASASGASSASRSKASRSTGGVRDHGRHHRGARGRGRGDRRSGQHLRSATGSAAEFPALLCEFKTDIATYLQTYTGPGYPKTLQDLIDFNNDHPELESGAPESNWNSLIFDLAQETGGRDADCAAQRAIATPGAQAAIDELMAAEDLDAIVAPTNGPAWVTDPVNGDLGGDFSTFIGSSGPPAVAGYANVTVPAGFVGPLPVGVSFIGGRWDEPTLIALAYAFEQETQVRVPPQFIPSIGDGASAARQPSSFEKQKASFPGRKQLEGASAVTRLSHRPAPDRRRTIARARVRALPRAARTAQYASAGLSVASSAPAP